MLRLVVSDRTVHLAGALAEQLRRARDRPDHRALAPVPVLVTHRALAAPLKLALAERLGVAANLVIEAPRAYLERHWLRPPEQTLWRARHVELRLIDLLRDPSRLEDAALAPVRRYLEASPTPGVARDLRTCQLASRLARLFEDYAEHRPDMLAGWSRDLAQPGGPVEGWERALWRRLEPGLVQDNLRSLAQLVTESKAAPGSVEPQVHVWGLSESSPALRIALAELARHTDVTVYALSAAQPQPDSDLEGVQAHPGAVMAGWGAPGHRALQHLQDLTVCGLEACFSTPTRPAKSGLQSLKQAVLQLGPDEAGPRPTGPDDPSLRFSACVSVRREVEAIAEAIWRLMAEDEARPSASPLRFDDIAVVLVGRDQEAYRAHIGAVFQQGCGIPQFVWQAPLAGQSRVVEAIELLLALPHSDFTRQDLLRLLTHPVVLSRYPQVDADEWLTWCHALCIVHGGDHRDHVDTYITRDLYNWDQGLRRLVLGAFMAPAPGEGARRFDLGGQSYLPHPLPQDRQTQLTELLVLVRAILADARHCERASMTLTDWADYLRTLIQTYVWPITAQDEGDLERIMTALEGLSTLHPRGAPTSFCIVAQLLRTRITALTRSPAPGVAQGVAVGPLSLLHSLPFRVVFMPGMAEGRFPASVQLSQLDLRTESPEPSDISSRQRDQQRFLHRLMNTQDVLHISWVARNAQTGDRIEPSSAVLHLQAVLQAELHAGDAAAVGRPERQPLWRYQDPLGPATSAASRAERQIVELRRALKDRLDGAPLPDLYTLRAAMDASAWQALAQRLGVITPPPPVPGAGIVQLPRQALLRFLEDPLEAWAEHVLRLQGDTLSHDPYARQDEVFRTPSHDEARLLAHVFMLGHDQAEVQMQAQYRTQAQLLELAGAMPTGVFQDSEARRHLDMLQVWRTQLRRAMGGRVRPLTRRVFGTSDHLGPHETPGPDLTLTLADGRLVRLYGATEPLCDQTPASFVALTHGPRPGPERTQPELRAFLDHALLVLAGAKFDRGYLGWIGYARGDDQDLVRVRFEAFDAPQARAWLTGLVEDLLNQAHAYCLPFATALAVHEAKDKGRLAIEQALAKTRPARPGPRALSEVSPPSADEAMHMLQRRLEPYWARRIEDGAP